MSASSHAEISQKVSAAELSVLLDEVLRRRAGLSERQYRDEIVRIGHRPGTKQLAEQAGISQRSLGRVFDCDPGQVSVWTADALLQAGGVSPLALRRLCDDGRPPVSDVDVGYAEDCLHVCDEQIVL